MKRRITGAGAVPFAAALLTLSAVAAWPEQALAFKAKTHVAMANVALRELDPTLGSASINGMGWMALQNPEVSAAIKAYPGAFRAGAMGPDAFPDLFGGQIWTHVNNGCKDPNGSACTPSNQVLESRPVGAWRSIDYGMYQLRRALALPTGEERSKSIAFAYGYLSHMLHDGFAHAWINEWSRDRFLIEEGSGLYGTPTEEIQHIAVESYLERHLTDGADNLEITVPTDFLRTLYRSPVADPNDLVQRGAEGAFVGSYFVKVIEVRNILDKLSNASNWPDLAGAHGMEAQIARSLLKQARPVSAVEGFLGPLNVIENIEDYFGRRRNVLDGVIDQWPRLSGCIAQNLVKGAAAKSAHQTLTHDACQDLNFETDPDTADVFEGTLNGAAWTGKGSASTDYGVMTVNVKKMLYFVEAAVHVGLRFSITEDIKSVREFLDLMDVCELGFANFGDAGEKCEAACNAYHDKCERVIEVAACFPCPRRGGKYSCKGWRALVCGSYPICAVCAYDWGLTHVVDETCRATATTVFGPVCELCNPKKSQMCFVYEHAREGVESVQALIAQVLQPLVDEIRRRAIEEVLNRALGPYAQQTIAAFEEFHEEASTASPGWMVNAAFMREDLQGDPAYLARMLESALGVDVEVVDGSVDIATAAAHTAAATYGAALPIVGGTTGQPQYVWTGFITTLYRIQRGENFNALLDMEGDPSFAWLDAVYSSRAAEGTRFVKFLVLLNDLKLLVNVQGPTLLALRAELGLDPSVPETDGGHVETHKLHVLHNAVEVTKVGLMGPAGVDVLLGRAGESTASSFTASSICAVTPHVACDVVQSLDDPSTIGAEPAKRKVVNGIDFDLSVARWRSNKWQWSGGRAWQPAVCDTALTDFPLAATPARVRLVYDVIFKYPPACLQARVNEVLPPLLELLLQ